MVEVGANVVMDVGRRLGRTVNGRPGLEVGTSLGGDPLTTRITRAKTNKMYMICDLLNHLLGFAHVGFNVV